MERGAGSERPASEAQRTAEANELAGAASQLRTAEGAHALEPD